MKKINKVLIELYKDKDQLLVLSVLFCASYLLQLLLPSDPNVNQASGAIVAIGAVVSIGVSMYNGAKNRDAASKAAKDAKIEKDKQIALLNEQKEQYKAFEFVNPYADAKNQFKDMENTMEDLTINQEQAKFEAEQGAQSRANIMQGMQGAAGGSGIASLAQAMANQGQLAARQASASIGQQESANQAKERQMAGQIQLQERQGEQQAEGLRLRGEEMVARQEAGRETALLNLQAGISGQATGASTSADQMSLQTDINARNATTAAISSGISSSTGAFASAQGAESGGEKIDAMDPEYQKTISQAGRDYLNS